jgi:DNA-binding CsgD family transcriptional regulator
MKLIPLGRQAEMARLESFLADVSGGPKLLLLEGDAGIGKTTLLEYGRNAAAELGQIVLSTSPVETEMPLAYAGLADLLETVPRAMVDALPLPQRDALCQAVFQIEPTSEPVQRRAMSMAVRTLFQGMAQTRPVVVVVDDLPWLDPPSARILSFVLRRMHREPLGLLAAARTNWSNERLPVALDGVPPDMLDRMYVGPLSLGAIREILGNRLGTTPGRSFLVRLHEVSGGNPLFALELAKRDCSVIPRGLFGTHDTPESLRRLVFTRIAALPTGARDVLLVCALTTDTSLPVICAASSSPAVAQSDLEEGILSGIVTIRDGEVTFAHPVIRSVIAGEARPADRRAAHRRLAAVVHNSEARARHLALGTQAPDEAAAQAVEEAAHAAARRGACDAAGDLAELAVAVTPLARIEERQRRVVLAAEQSFASSDPARACSLLEAILSTIPSGPVRAEVIRRLARYRAFRGEPVAAWSAMLRDALAQAGHDPRLRAAIMLDQAVAAISAGDYADARRCGWQAMDFAEQTADGALVAQCYAALTFEAFMTGDGMRRELISRALAGPEQPRALSVEKRPNVAVGHVLHWAGDLDGARACYEQEYAQAVAEGVETSLPLLLWAMAENEAWAGDWRRAEQLATEGYGLAEDSASPTAIAFMSGTRGLLHAYRGRIEPARADGARALEQAGALGLPLLAIVGAQPLGIAALSVGDAEGAHAQLGPVAEAVLGAGVVEPSVCRFVPDEIEALTRLGRLEAAEALLGPFEDRSARLQRSWGLAAGQRCRGLLLASRGDTAAAATALESALASIRRLTLPFEEARTLLAAGEVHRRARHKHMAVAYLGEALCEFERLGAPLWAMRARGELDRVGIRGPRAESGPALTAAEQRVVGLVVAGRTNTEIAAQLFMGRRTVEAHLYRVYQKLAVRSRTELCHTVLAD